MAKATLSDDLQKEHADVLVMLDILDALRLRLVQTLAPAAQAEMREAFDAIEEEVVGRGRHQALERSLRLLTEQYLPGRHHKHG